MLNNIGGYKQCLYLFFTIIKGDIMDTNFNNKLRFSKILPPNSNNDYVYIQKDYTNVDFSPIANADIWYITIHHIDVAGIRGVYWMFPVDFYNNSKLLLPADDGSRVIIEKNVNSWLANGGQTNYGARFYGYNLLI